jgi:hypothetical protein
LSHRPPTPDQPLRSHTTDSLRLWFRHQPPLVSMLLVIYLQPMTVLYSQHPQDDAKLSVATLLPHRPPTPDQPLRSHTTDPLRLWFRHQLPLVSLLLVICLQPMTAHY